MRRHHWYHLYADGDWIDATSTHIETLRRSPIDFASVHVGLVGTWEARMAAGLWLAACWPEASIDVDVDDGFELPTLQHLADSLDTLHGDDVVFYAHTKGAGHPGVLNDVWRDGMLEVLVRGYDHCAGRWATEGGYDIATCHWLRPELQTDPDFGDRPYPGGNFWWATVDYLRTLPSPIPTSSRYEAEAWVGTGPRPPRVLNLDARHPWHAYAHRAKQRLRATARTGG